MVLLRAFVRIASCKAAVGGRPGGRINTSTTGAHHFEVIAISLDDLKTTQIVSYTVRRG